MTKLMTTLLLAATLSTSVLADANEENKAPKKPNLLETIFNSTAYDDGCVTYPMCDFDDIVSEADRMVMEDERNNKTNLASETTDPKKNQ